MAQDSSPGTADVNAALNLVVLTMLNEQVKKVCFGKCFGNKFGDTLNKNEQICLAKCMDRMRHLRQPGVSRSCPNPIRVTSGTSQNRPVLQQSQDLAPHNLSLEYLSLCVSRHWLCLAIMGIKGLWDAVAAAGVSSRVELLRGKKVAIDASFWIAHCLASETAVRRGNDIYGVFFLRICYLLEKRIFPIFVFDGRTPGAKRRTLMLRNMSRAKRTRNLKLLAFKALAVQMKHLAKSGNKRLFKPSSYMKRKGSISSRELQKISTDIDETLNESTPDSGAVPAIADLSPPPETQEECLFSSDDEFADLSAAQAEPDPQEPVSATDRRINLLTMPKSYRALKMRSRQGAEVDLTSAPADNELAASYFDNHGFHRGHHSSSNRSKRQIELPLDSTIHPDTYERMPSDVRYQIMQQIKDAWMYDDRVNLLQLKSSLSEFSSLQVESYLRDVDINREIERIKRDLVRETLPSGFIKSEDDTNTEALLDQSMKHDIFDYNAVEPKTRRKRGFLNDLSTNMQPDLYNFAATTTVKPEPQDVDDSLFLRDSDIFGDLVKSESDDEFELLDERTSAKPADDFEIIEEEPCVAPHGASGGFITIKNAVGSEMGDGWQYEACLLQADQRTTAFEDIGADTNSPSNVDVGTFDPELEQEDSATRSDGESSALPTDSDDNSDASYDPARDDLDPSFPDGGRGAPSQSDSSVEFVSDGSSESSEPSLHLTDAEEDGDDSTPEDGDDLSTPQAGTSIALEDVATTAVERGTTATVDVSANTATQPEAASPTTGTTDMGVAALEATPMYTNEWEYREHLHAEKLLSRVERSQYRMDEWDKVPQLLELFGLPYLVAPSEAEAQCAHLNKIGQCFGVISDDSDTLAFGATRVFKNFYHGNVFEVYVAHRVLRELGLGREQIALLAIICGCDYTPGVRGIGVVNALEVIKAYPTFDELYEFRSWATDACDLATVTDDPCPAKQAYKEAHVNYRTHWSFPSDFPNREAYNLFLAPVVSSTFDPHWRQPRYDALSSFMAKHSSLPQSEVSACLEALRREDDFDGFILEDFVPEIHSRSLSRRKGTLKGNRKVLQDRMQSFRDFLSARKDRRARKAGARRAARRSPREPPTPVAFIRSKRMLASIEGLKQRVNQERGASS
ncbi:XPG N-terminal domain-containing protein [Babesia caballi]|uniref:XPG N-terminal domain-containing protein n=1 Tax=Babesia caballi TaxID=5871 RepID=A0AAV4M004_BABCB|nr:XPG N-terminal domain-containing protein [Babesia caballi]